MQKVFQQGLVSRMSEYQKRVQNLNLEMSRLKEENNSNLGHFVQGGIQALQSLQNTVTDEEIENAALNGKIKCGTYCGTAQVFPHCHVSDLCF